MRSIRRHAFALLGVLCIVLGAAMACASSHAPDQVHVLTWKGEVNPVMARYIERGISTAERSQARAVVLKLDTPGGQDGSMREIIQRIESSKVPVIVYVSPSGGRAASAGTFITMSANIAAMAPNTTIGAATPINSTGEDIPGALGRKITNDAVAYIRSIAELRGRNADWAESAVRDAVAVSETQAVDLNVVDFIASGTPELLAKSDGRSVQVKGDADAMQTVTLHTTNAATFENDPTFFESLLYHIADPNIAFLLLSLGGLALVTEVFHPTFLAGIFGVISLILAYFSLGSLPTNWAGVALILFGFVLVGAEIFVSGFGVLGVGGAVSLVLGGLILMGGNDSPEVSRWLVFGLSAVIVVFLVFFVGALVRLRRMPARSGNESLFGMKGTTRSRLDPKGLVMVRGERWEATAEDPPLEDGAEIIVIAAEGLLLRVKRDPASIKLLPAGESARS